MEGVCSSCGAPAKPGHIICEFCENPVNAEAARRAIPCRQCQTLNVETAQQCIKCKGWLVVQCLFCNHLTRNDAPACHACREPFAGAAERKAQRDADARRQQYFQVAGAVAPLAGSLLGGVAGAFLGNQWSPSSHHHVPSSYQGSSYGNHSYHGQHTESHRIGESFAEDSSYSSSSSSSSSSSEGGFFDSLLGGGSSSNERSESSGSSEGGGFFDSLAESFSDDDGGGTRG